MDHAFAERFQAYREAVRQARGVSHDQVRHALLAFLRDALGVDLGDLTLERPVARGLVDALLGRLVLEVKRDLAQEGPDAEAKLLRYVEALRREEPSARFTAVATDGLRFRVYRPVEEGGALRLEALAEADLERIGPEDVRRWLLSLLAHFRREVLPADPATFQALFGSASPSFRTAFARLHRLMQGLQGHPSLETRFRVWRSYLAVVYGSPVGGPDLFLRHTYLAFLARLLGALALDPTVLTAPPANLARVLRGSWFHEFGIVNFAEEDFFTWPLLPSVQEEGLALAWDLLQALGRVDLSRLSADVLKGLYEDLVDPADRHDLGEYYTPDWLVEWLLREELRLPEHPDASVLDPACGSGTFLFFALRLLRSALEARGLPEEEVLFHLTQQVVGADVHPLAVGIARTNYLLALGELARKARRFPLHLPVFLADTLRLPEGSHARPLGGGGPPFYTFPVDLGPGLPRLSWELPARAVEDPWALLALVDRMVREYALPALQHPPDSPGEARVLERFRTYLLARKGPRAEMPLSLSPEEADLVVDALKTYLRLVREGHDGVWAHILSNTFVPIALHRRRFDLVVGNPPWLSIRYLQNPDYARRIRRLGQDYRLLDPREPHLFTQMELATLFFARSADLYLKEGGRIAFVLPRGVLGYARQHRAFARGDLADPEGRPLPLRWERVLDLEGVAPLFGSRGGGPGTVPACVVVARKGEGPAREVPALRLEGSLPHRNADLETARRHLKAHEHMLTLQGDVWAPAG